nr:MAG TPA: hypothetical protein [Bacteriophage sp.]
MLGAILNESIGFIPSAIYSLIIFSSSYLCVILSFSIFSHPVSFTGKLPRIFMSASFISLNSLSLSKSPPIAFLNLHICHLSLLEYTITP